MIIEEKRKFIRESFDGLGSGETRIRISEVSKNSFNLTITFPLTETEKVSSEFLIEILERINRVENEFGLKSDFWNGCNNKNSRSSKERSNSFTIGFVFYIDEVVKDYETTVWNDLNTIVTNLRDCHFEDEMTTGIITFSVSLTSFFEETTLKSQYDFSPNISVKFSKETNGKVLRDIENTMKSLLNTSDLKLISKKTVLRNLNYYLIDKVNVNS
jgi:hypothetical protein